jgi:hypothetical protein
VHCDSWGGHRRDDKHIPIKEKDQSKKKFVTIPINMVLILK